MVVLGPKDMEHATAEDEVVFAPGALGQRSSDAGRARTRAARKGFAAAALVHAHLDSRLSDVGKQKILFAVYAQVLENVILKLKMMLKKYLKKNLKI